MKIHEPHRSQILALPRVGERLVSRLERAGFYSMERLAGSTVAQIVPQLIDSEARNLWVRSSLARAAIRSVIRYARTVSQQDALRTHSVI